MNQNPNHVALKLVEEEISGDMQLLIGKAMVSEGEIKGYAVFVLNSKQFQSVIGKLDSQTVITDKYGYIYVSNNYNFSDNMKRVKLELAFPHGYIENDFGKYYVTSNTILNDQIYIYSISPLNNQITLLKYVFFILLFVFAMIIIFVILSTKGLAAKKSKDLYTILRGLEKVKEGDLNTHIDISSNDEFETIGESYNLMIDSLKEQIERNIEMGRLVSFSQTKQLESQFNPHFMFNTLENIRFMCKLDPQSASKMVLNLSTLLRYSISNTQEEVTVKEDLVYTENYLSILKYRFNQRFHYVINIPAEVEQCIIPKLIIQPMIENAIKYGFEGKECLLVEVNGYIEDNKLVLQCSDDGAGMKPDTLLKIKKIIGDSINRSSHSGLYNIHRRIELRYGEGYGIQITSELGSGTCLKVV
jgi:two-component system sensor histidine kinase YesM